MSVQGIFASNQGIVAERQQDFATAILMTQPTGTALLLALTSGMPKTGASDTVFNWFEDSHLSGRTGTVSGGTGTTVVVNDGSMYVPSTILLVEETGELLLVEATNNNSLTVSRGMAGTPVTSITNVMNVYAIGNAREEGSGMPTAVTQQGHARMNFTQIFRNGWAITGTAKAVKFTTGDKMAYNKKMCASYHAEDMEKSMLWGRKHLGIRNGKQFRMTDGIVAQIENYGGSVRSAASGGVAGQLSLADFDDWIRDLFKKQVKGQPNERIAIGGDQVVAVLNRGVMLDGQYEIKAGESKHGISVWEYMTPFGKLKLTTHPLMTESPYWAKQLYGLHPGGIRRRVLRDTFEENYDSNGDRINGKDADEGAITTEMGIEVGAAHTMGILRNVTTAVKSN